MEADFEGSGSCSGIGASGSGSHGIVCSDSEACLVLLLKTEEEQGWMPAVVYTDPAMRFIVSLVSVARVTSEYLRNFSARLRANLDSLIVDPVTMSFEQPTWFARSTTPWRSSGWLCFPRYLPRKMGSVRLIPIYGGRFISLNIAFEG